jgi:hypothetical protein
MPFFKVPGSVNGIAPMRKFSSGGSANAARSPVWHQEPGLGWHDHLLSRSNLDAPDVANKRVGTKEWPQEAAPETPDLVSESLSDERFAEHIMGLIKEAIALAEVRQASLTRWDADAKKLTQYWFGASDDAIKAHLLPIMGSLLRVLRGLSPKSFLPYSSENTQSVGCSPQVDQNADAAACPTDTQEHRIFLAAKFFKRDAFNRVYGTKEFLPRDSQLSILIHEITHFKDVASSNDAYYGIRNAKSISEKTESAKINADSLAAYVLGITIK